MRTIFKFTMTAAMLLTISGCQAKTPDKEDIVLKDAAIQHEPEFGGIYIKIGIDDFNQLGFTYGDSVDVSFSNGYILEDIPYYNGYYVDAGEPLLIAYPGYDYIKAAVNYGDDLWETANLKTGLGAKTEKPEGLWLNAKLEEHDTASVSLREKGKYLDIQEARDIHYYDEREKYDSDVIFGNFRAMNLTGMKENVFYRSASPCDNQHKRAPYVDQLMEEAGIKAILNLSDNETKIESYMARDDFNSPYFTSLYDNGTVYPIALNMNYLSDEFGQKIADGFTKLTQTEGPYLIHCTEGKDRTGFVCMLVEMLAGAPFEEIVSDYMITYDNYYQINETKEQDKYKTIRDKNLIAMMSFVCGTEPQDLQTTDLQAAAKTYLTEHGMSEEALQ
ncbi:MAG: tyrosine-protein phosphatase, partial [Solobacterium sp.]|nr:tyrosine-protein phosphatase [Solobacterium sp.]